MKSAFGLGAAMSLAVSIGAVSRQIPDARLDVRAAAPPVAFRGSDGQTHLAYELRVEVLGTTGVRLQRVEVFDDLSGKSLLVYSGDDLDGRVMRPGVAADLRYGRVVRPGTAAFVHLWVTLPGKAVPRALRHSVLAAPEDGPGEMGNVTRIAVQRRAPRVLGPPLRKGTWLIHNGPGAHQSAHWGSVLVSNGRATIPQRFAIDFIGVDEQGRAVQGDFQKSSNSDWVGFGAEVVAVAGGTVRAVRDGLPDNVPLVEPPPPEDVTLSAIGGNYVVLELGATTFVEYVHLQQGSVAVKAGQRVRRGQVLGRLGNSGNTNAPHLHFGLESAEAFEESEGLPFVIESFDLVGETTADRALGAEPPSTAAAPPPSKHNRELPLHGAVVRFR